MKAYSSCVGDGPFVTELAMTEEEKHALREAGHEYGAATGLSLIHICLFRAPCPGYAALGNLFSAAQLLPEHADVYKRQVQRQPPDRRASGLRRL